MTIKRTDLVIFKPEGLGDNDQAGGQRTNNKVTSGLLNDLFGPISDIDHAQSAIQIVKAYPALNTTGTEELIGAHVFISTPPVDPLVNVMIVESADLNDNSRMPEMVDIMESGIVPGNIIQNAGPGFIKYQDNFSRSYLTRKEGTSNVTSVLSVGDVIALTVEYTGTDSATWPRREHIAQITDIAGNTPASLIYFSPAIEFDTPDPSVSINSQTGCTKIRFTSVIPSLKYHGVSALEGIAAIGATTLNVAETSQAIVPAVTVQQDYTNLKPFDGGLLRKVLSGPNGTSTGHVFTVPDLLVEGSANVSYSPVASYMNAAGKTITTSDGVEFGGSIVRVTLPETAISPITISYLSSGRYANHLYSASFPVGKEVVKNTVSSSISVSGTRLSCTEFPDGFYVLSAGVYTKAGEFNYTTGVFTAEAPEFTAFQYSALVYTPGTDFAVTFPLTISNPKLDTFILTVVSGTGTLLSGTSNLSGTVVGTNVSGTIEDGIVELTFGVAVDLHTLTYSVTDIYESLPPADVFNIDPLKVPDGGIVPIFRKWGVVAIQHSQFQVVASPAPAQVKTIRANSRFADITDATGASLWTDVNTHYTADLVAGTVTINSNFPGFTAPFTLTDTIGELAMVTTVNQDDLRIAAGVTREYPVGSTVASVQDLGDLVARVGPVRDMTSWNSNWDQDGTPANSNLNTAAYPIEVTNDGSINEDWVIIFTTATAFRLVGRYIGQVATGDTLNDFIPINTVVNKPYFTIRQEAFGGGWSAGEAIRFETFAAAQPVMLVRVVKSGHSQITTDRAILSFRGNEA